MRYTKKLLDIKKILSVFVIKWFFLHELLLRSFYELNLIKNCPVFSFENNSRVFTKTHIPHKTKKKT